MAGAILIATTSALIPFGGREVMIAGGRTTAREGHPILEGRGYLFRVLVPDYEVAEPAAEPAQPEPAAKPAPRKPASPPPPSAPLPPPAAAPVPAASQPSGPKTAAAGEPGSK